MLETEASLAHDSSFTAKEREAINLIVSQVNQCDYCFAAHTTIAKMRGFTEEDTLEIRKGGFQMKNLMPSLNWHSPSPIIREVQKTKF